MYYEETVLDDGTTISTEFMPAARSITLGFWFHVGSRDETPKLAGMSHFMEHMLFKGTKERTPQQISAEMESLGAEFNAFTSHEYTCFYARFVDDKLERAFDILADMIIDSTFDDDAIESEREVVLEEVARSIDTPEDYIFDLFSDALFPTYPVGRPILGTTETVASFEHDDCVSYHDAHYRTGNLVVAAAGNIDHKHLVELCRTRLREMKNARRSERASDYHDENRAFTSVRKDTEQAHLIYGMPSLAADSPDRFASSLLDSAFGGGMSSRLFQEIREKRGLAYSVFDLSQPYTDTGEFCIYAGTRPGNLAQVVEIIRGQIDLLVSRNLTQEELERACDYVSGQLVLHMESSRSRMSYLGKNRVMGIEPPSLEECLAAYRAVSLDDISRVAHETLTKPATLAIISPYTSEELEGMLS